MLRINRRTDYIVRVILALAKYTGGRLSARKIQEQMLIPLYEAIEGCLLISECLEAATACPLEQGCPVHLRWRGLQDLIVHELDRVTMSELASEAHQSSNHCPEYF